MKIAIIDDSTSDLYALCKYLREFLPPAAEIAEHTDAAAFLASFECGSCDIIILDIYMGELTGTEVARRIRETDRNVSIVFCSSSNDFAAESYEVCACYYILKPVSREGVKAMVDRLDIQKLELLRSAKLPGGESVVLRSIVYADFASHHVTLHCKNGSDISVRSSFSEIEPLLCAYPYFFSPCKGVIVNFYEVSECSGDTFVMRDKTIVPISRRRSKDVLEAYSAFMFDNMRKDRES